MGAGMVARRPQITGASYSSDTTRATLLHRLHLNFQDKGLVTNAPLVGSQFASLPNNRTFLTCSIAFFLSLELPRLTTARVRCFYTGVTTRCSLECVRAVRQAAPAVPFTPGSERKCLSYTQCLQC